MVRDTRLLSKVETIRSLFSLTSLRERMPTAPSGQNPYRKPSVPRKRQGCEVLVLTLLSRSES